MKEYKYTIGGKKYEVTIGDIENNIANVTVNGETYKVEMEPEKEPEKPKVVKPAPKPAATSSPAANPAAAKKAALRDAVVAPLPGTVVEITVNVGDEVKAGDVCVVLEAMKMKNNLETEKAGKVKEILIQEGQSVMEGDPLIVIE